MSWWLNIIEYLRSAENNLENGNFHFKKTIAKALAESAVDVLYYALGFFTSLYFVATVYLFFTTGRYHDLGIRIFIALSEPYFGSVGIYVILKEVRKKQQKTKSRHFGEFFVYSWLVLFLMAAGLVWFLPDYHFDELMSTITTITLASVVIYMGGIIHKP